MVPVYTCTLGTVDTASSMGPAQALVVVLLFTLLAPTAGCSFIVSNFPVNATGKFALINFFNVRRGPDATNVHRSEDGWHFVHNLLSMTGAVTLQPFISNDGSVVALFNGEIYNFRCLATELEGVRHAYRSDGFAILPAYARWGREFVQHLDGEFAIVLVDFGRREVILTTDVFSTKPLWYAIWDEEATAAGGAAMPRRRFVAASYESVLVGLGAPASARRMANANEALVLRLPRRRVSSEGTMRQQRLAHSEVTSVDGRQLPISVEGRQLQAVTSGQLAKYATFDERTQVVTWNHTDSFWEDLCPAAASPAAATITADAQPPLGRALGEQGGGARVTDVEDAFEQLAVLPLVTWDLRQHKTHTRDWAAAFRRAVAMRTRGIKHRVFIGLSSGYDSGAIMLALKEQVTRMPAPLSCVHFVILRRPHTPDSPGVRSGWYAN